MIYLVVFILGVIIYKYIERKFLVYRENKRILEDNSTPKYPNLTTNGKTTNEWDKEYERKKKNKNKNKYG